MKVAIHWFRRDLRLTDNTALNAAAAVAEQVVPVYILSDWQRTHHWVGPNRQEFLCASLASLAGNLDAAGGRLIVRCGPAERELEKLVLESRAEAIFFNRDPDPFGRAVEDRLEKFAKKWGVGVCGYRDIAMHEADALLNGSGDPYRVYSPYRRAWQELPKAEVGPRLRHLRTPSGLKSLGLPTLAHWKLESSGAEILEGGERAARRRLSAFFNTAGPATRYAVGRTHLMGDTTSRFSADLRWGLLSIREIYHHARALADDLDAAGRTQVEKFIAELAWREFYLQILHHFPGVLDREFDPATRNIPWRWARDHEEIFRRWCEGTTGFPIVDAGMRQLRACGYMQNRLRMITAMFLTKDLRIHWKDGEAYFLRHLVDGEIANNNGGWQWSAGTGADAAPYFRIQNPWTQSQRFDPKGEFIRQWVPELANVPAKCFHAPPANGGRLAKDYPPPMVDHAIERRATLAMFQNHRR